MGRSKRKIPNRLWLYRELKGLTQNEVAAKLQLTNPSMVSRWEQGKSMPNGEQLLKLSLMYNTFDQELYYEEVIRYRRELGLPGIKPWPRK